MTTDGSDSLANGSYQCMPREVLRHGRYSVTAVRTDHIEDIRRWRNAQMDVLRQPAPISPDAQEAYFASKIWPHKDSLQPGNILLSYSEDDVAIGYGGLVHIAWEHRRAEVSFLLGGDSEYDVDRRDLLFSSFLGLIQGLAFLDLGLERLWTETYAHRTGHIDTLERCGFRQEGVLRSHVHIAGAPTDAIVHGCLVTEMENTG